MKSIYINDLYDFKKDGFMLSDFKSISPHDLLIKI